MGLACRIAIIVLLAGLAGCSDKAEVEKLRADVKAQEEIAARLAVQRDAVIAQRDATKLRADDLAAKNADLETRLKVAEENVAALRAAMIQLQEEHAKLQSLIPKIGSEPNRVPVPPYPSTPVLAGRVTAVDAAAKTARINLGSDDGVGAGMVFIVYQAPAMRYRAELTVKTVEAASAEGDLSTIRDFVQVGDNVTNKPGD